MLSRGDLEAIQKRDRDYRGRLDAHHSFKNQAEDDRHALLDHIAALEEELREIVADLEDDDPAPVDAALQKGRRLLGEGPDGD